MIRAVLAALICVWLLPGSANVALAHQPVCEFADLSARSPWLVPDASISYAYFGNVYPPGDIDYFTFEAAAGQRVLISLSIPAIEGVEVFAPRLALMGPGIPADDSLDLPAGLRAPDGQGIVAINLGGQPNYWYEPFSRRYFWNFADSFFVAPQTAAYTVALWHPDEEIGRYSFVIGQREVFGGDMECFASFYEYWTPLQADVNPYRDTILAAAGLPQGHGKTLEMPAAGAPQVELQLYPLSGGGYNARIVTRNFLFTPQNVDGEAVPGEGHAHLYLDGVKIARVYGEWHYLASLPDEAQTLGVALYANDHSAFAVDGMLVGDTLSLAEALASSS